MERTLEPEVMDTRSEALAYDAMDHSAPNAAFVGRLVALGASGRMIDLGTGPGRVPLLVCARIPGSQVVAVDLAESMLDLARARVARSPFAARIAVRRADVKMLDEPDDSFDVVFSNTVLHHIPDPVRLLAEAARVLRPGGALLIRDLLRPDIPEDAVALVRRHAADETAEQQELLCASLHAALTSGELREAADRAGLRNAQVTADSDRHQSLQLHASE